MWLIEDVVRYANYDIWRPRSAKLVETAETDELKPPETGESAECPSAVAVRRIDIFEIASEWI